MTATSLLSSGCSLFIAQSGTDLQSFSTRDQVRARFGTPTANGSQDGVAFDQYRTRRKFADEREAASNGMGFAMTFGLSEFIAFPREVYLLAKRTIVGQDLRFDYDESGDVSNASLNGVWPYLQRPDAWPNADIDDKPDDGETLAEVFSQRSVGQPCPEQQELPQTGATAVSE